MGVLGSEESLSDCTLLYGKICFTEGAVVKYVFVVQNLTSFLSDALRRTTNKGNKGEVERTAVS